MPIVATKLLAPALTKGLVSRPDLYSKLDRLKDCKVLFVVAPAGYGKSSLIALWEQTVSPMELQFSWLTLDDVDNDFIRFWSYILAAFEKFLPGLQTKLAAQLYKNTQHFEEFVDCLLSELCLSLNTESGENYILVLDNYHLVADDTISKSVTYFLKNIPSALHLIFLSRVIPKLPVSLFLIRNQGITLNITDLRFSEQEVADFLSSRLRRQFSNEEVNELQSVIAGWPAALQLTILTINDRESIHHFLGQLKEHKKDIGGFLISEILAPLSASETTFLYKISILRCFNASLCECLTHQDNSQKMIEHLQRDSMFIVPLDGKEGWYQFHQLTAELLQTKLEHELPTQAAKLHSLASKWYENHQMFGEAMIHAESARDWPRLADLIEARYRSLIQRGRFVFLIRILKTLPKELFIERPILSLVHAWASLGADKTKEAMRYIRYSEKKLEALANSDPELAQKIKPEIAILKASCKGMNGNVKDGLSLVDQLLDDEEETDTFIQSWALNAAGTAASRGKDSAEAISILKKCIAIAKSADNLTIELTASYFLGREYSQMGRLTRSDNVHQQAERRLAAKGAENYHYAGLCKIGLSDNERERGSLEHAEALLLCGIEQMSKVKGVEFYAEAQISLALLRRAQGNITMSIQILDEALGFAQEHNISRAASEIKAYLARFHAETGLKGMAYHWLQNHYLDINKEDVSLSETQDLMTARIYLVCNENDKALRVLDDLMLELLTTGRKRALLEALLLRSLLLFSVGQTSQAYYPLQESLKLAWPEDYTQVYLDEGQSLQYLLSSYYVSQLESKDGSSQLKNFAKKLLDSNPIACDRTKEVPYYAHKPLLTTREQEVCNLLILGYNNREIAQTLSISENTVHTHRSNIYAKLNVKNRKELVEVTGKQDIV